jgi:redox-sensing transcriptional repressor
MEKPRAPERTVERLCLYRRVLFQMEKEGKNTTSSYEIAEKADILDSQVRKDLSFFGHFGIGGKGYKINELRTKIEQIVGKNRVWRMAVVGAGNLGSALIRYPQFKKEGVEMIAAFDNDLRKVGKMCSGLLVEDVKNLAEGLKKKKIDIGIIAVPAHAAQEVANSLVKAGIRAILNFAPCRLRVSESVKVLNVDFCLNVEVLTHFLAAAT